MSLTGTDTKIQWSQFKKKLRQHPVGKDYDAETTAEYKATHIIPDRNKNAIIVKSADVKVLLNTHESWFVIGKTTDYLLNHEQGHYEISVIAAQEFYRELFTLAAPTPNDLDANIKSLNADIQQKIDNTNNRYDNQTNHSQNQAQQDIWNKAIIAEKQKKDGSLSNLPQ